MPPDLFLDEQAVRQVIANLQAARRHLDWLSGQRPAAVLNQSRGYARTALIELSDRLMGCSVAMGQFIDHHINLLENVLAEFQTAEAALNVQAQELNPIERIGG